MGIQLVGELVPCTECLEVKGKRMAVSWATSSRSTKLLERVFVDLSEKRLRSPGSEGCLMMIVDDFSRIAWPYFLKKKSAVPAVFARFLLGILAQGTPSTVKRLDSDNRTQCTNQEFVALPDHHRIRCECTPVDSSKHNGVAEHGIAITVELAMASRL